MGLAGVRPTTSSLAVQDYHTRSQTETHIQEPVSRIVIATEWSCAQGRMYSCMAVAWTAGKNCWSIRSMSEYSHLEMNPRFFIIPLNFNSFFKLIFNTSNLIFYEWITLQEICVCIWFFCGSFIICILFIYSFTREILLQRFNKIRVWATIILYC